MANRGALYAGSSPFRAPDADLGEDGELAVLQPRAHRSLRRCLECLLVTLLRLELERRQHVALVQAARTAYPLLRQVAPGARATAALGRALGEE